MSKNSKNNSKSPHTVLSKYFSSSPVMDESLSEFKEKKKGITGPKDTLKSVGIKGRAKKALKRIRGQKDIRTALKSKKNELLTYTKEFDEVCKQSGVDIDSEQLQLAIALSKSVESQENECQASSEDCLPLSSKERTGRIRTTLQQYGFTVPEIKITSNKRQKKKLRKNYRLLLATDAEKQQIVSDRYCQVLFENVCDSKERVSEYGLVDKKFYYLSTNVSYMEMKDNNILYVDELIAKSYTNGVLLRDWAQIPGRPQSPKSYHKLEMNFSEIECSQEELDIVLSGTLKSAKSIIHKKAKIIENTTPLITINDDNSSDLVGNNRNVNGNKCFKNTDNENINITPLCNYVNVKDKLTDIVNISLNTLDRVRSKSPDIFDDETSEVWDRSNSNMQNSKNYDVITDLTTDNCNDRENDGGIQIKPFNIEQKENQNAIIDLSEAENSIIEDVAYKANYKNNIQPEENYSSIINLEANHDVEMLNTNNMSLNSPKVTFTQANNLTRRISNDCMEITECVAINYKVDSETTIQNENKTRRVSNDLMEITDCVNDDVQTNHVNYGDKIDLTQTSEKNNDTVLDARVPNEICKVVDISQSSNSEDELPLVQISCSNKNSLDDTILLNNDEIFVNGNPSNSSNHDEVVFVEENKNNEDNLDSLDLTQTPPSPPEYRKTASQSFFGEFVHSHSENTTIETLDVSSHSDNNSKVNSDDKIDLTQSNLSINVHEDVEVDLTQSSSSSEDSIKNRRRSTTTPAKSSIKRKEEVSIDYDELFDNITEEQTNVNNKTDNSLCQSATDSTDDNDAKSESQSRSSQVFDLSDKEFEYSVNKSRNDFAFDVNFGSISVMDNMSDVGNRHSENNIDRLSKSKNSMNKSLSDSYLPVVNINGYANTKKAPIEVNNKTSNEDRLCKPTAGLTNDKVNANEVTPYREYAKENAFTTDTPRNSEYIIKTDQVTPMLDYASMTTPERNRELDKYGLKPFKRKRAIQLLTHLYNQTHPVVESCLEDLPSPSKRRKHSSQPSPIKPVECLKKLKSPKKTLKSTRKLLKSSKKLLKSPNKLLESPKKSPQNDFRLDCNEETLLNVYEVTNEVPEIRDIACSEEDWVFQKREKAKLHTCRAPLHIALHNYVSCRRRLREAILKYEPVNIDVIHKGLVASGYRYDPKELLKYMDKKCITVKTADNNAKNKR